MIYSPVPCMCKITPIPLLPLNAPTAESLHPRPPLQALSPGGKEPFRFLTMNRGEPLARGPWLSGQEAEEAAGAGLGEWRGRDSEMGSGGPEGATEGAAVTDTNQLSSSLSPPPSPLVTKNQRPYRIGS